MQHIMGSKWVKIEILERKVMMSRKFIDFFPSFDLLFSIMRH